ncbi:MAG: nucleotidyltransferase family protein [Aquisalinus sp.]|nr:nucleotidyltransferase family protein [Aquisalinus sp.]
MNNLAAIILAAGESTRFGERNKLLARLNGKPVLTHTLETVSALGLGQVILVSGHDRQMVERLAVNYPVSPHHNEAYRSGMGSSIACGVHELHAATKGVFVCPGDMPYLPAAVFHAMASRFATNEQQAIIRPSFDGKPGHPVLFPAHLYSDLAQLSDDLGARAIITRNPSRLVILNWPDNTVLTDIDRQEDLPGQDPR